VNHSAYASFINRAPKRDPKSPLKHSCGHLSATLKEGGYYGNYDPRNSKCPQCRAEDAEALKNWTPGKVSEKSDLEKRADYEYSKHIENTL